MPLILAILAVLFAFPAIAQQPGEMEKRIYVFVGPTDDQVREARPLHGNYSSTLPPECGFGAQSGKPHVYCEGRGHIFGEVLHIVRDDCVPAVSIVYWDQIPGWKIVPAAVAEKKINDALSAEYCSKRKY